MKKRLSILAVAIAATFPMAQTAHAQSNAELKQEIDLLKKQLQVLMQKVDAAAAASTSTAASASNQGAVELQEFNRIKIKAESTEDAVEASGLKGFKVSGVMDPTFIYSQGQNRSGFIFLNNFDGAGGAPLSTDSYAFDNSSFGSAVLDIQKETDGGNKWRLTLAPHKSGGSAYRAGSIVHEASVSIPLTDEKTRLIAGQIPDWSGYELTAANQNPLVTHNLLFDFSAVTYYSGAGMEIIRGPWTSKFMLGNVNQAARESGDKDPALVYRVDYAVNEYSGIGLWGGHSFSSPSTSAGRFDMLEVDGYFTRGQLTLQGQVGAGRHEGKAGNGGDAQWWGLSGLVGYKLTPRTQLVARYDFINNANNGGGVYNGVGGVGTLGDSRNGFGPAWEDDGTGTNTWFQPDPSTGVNRYALSVGLNYLINPTTSLKTELRYDGASGAVFSQPDGSYKNTNLLFGTSVVVSF
ncbi:MAG: DUF3138 family protein [Rhodoferax sp.]|uniref:DUF3138 family protein n=1 Tax=Rhodoferax sp. TaxID=50421 RepID=UPI00301881AA